MDGSMVGFIRDLGFPIFVSVYLLLYELPKGRKATEELKIAVIGLNSAIAELCSCVKG